MEKLKNILKLGFLLFVSSILVGCESFTKVVLSIPTPIRREVVAIHYESHFMAMCLLRINQNWALAEERYDDYYAQKAALEALQSSPTDSVSAVDTAIDKSKEVEIDYTRNINLTIFERKEIESELARDYKEAIARLTKIGLLYKISLDKTSNEQDGVMQTAMLLQLSSTAHIILLMPDFYNAVKNPIVYNIIDRDSKINKQKGESTKDILADLENVTPTEVVVNKKIEAI